MSSKIGARTLAKTSLDRLQSGITSVPWKRAWRGCSTFGPVHLGGAGMAVSRGLDISRGASAN